MKNLEKMREESLGFLFGEISRLHHSRVHSIFAEHGLHRGQHRILFVLWHGDGVTQKELSEEINLAPATITDALQRMEKAGLIERRADVEDQRISRVYLTDKGKDLQLKVFDVFKSMEDESFKDFTVEEKILLRRFFIQIRDNLRSMDGGK
jgi:MarR family transcriptional regulator, organic hydroperoxide resistance regulator